MNKQIVSSLIDDGLASLKEAMKGPLSPETKEELQDEVILTLGSVVNDKVVSGDIGAYEAQGYYDEVFAKLLKKAFRLADVRGESQPKSRIPEGMLKELIAQELAKEAARKGEDMKKEAEEETPYFCEDCGWSGKESDVDTIESDESGEAPGDFDTKPVCPKCKGNNISPGKGKKSSKVAREGWTERKFATDPDIMIERIFIVDNPKASSIARGAVHIHNKVYSWTAKWPGSDPKEWKGSQELFKDMISMGWDDEDYKTVEAAIRKALKTGKETEGMTEEQLATSQERAKRQMEQSVGSEDKKVFDQYSPYEWPKNERATWEGLRQQVPNAEVEGIRDISKKGFRRVYKKRADVVPLELED